MSKFITTCRVKDHNAIVECGQQIIDHAIDVPIIGEPPTVRTQRFMEALGKHLHRKHPMHAQLTMNMGAQFTGYLIAQSFRTEDPGLVAVQEQLRSHLFVMTRKNYITDEQIVETVAKLGATAEEGAPY